MTKEYWINEAQYRVQIYVSYGLIDEAEAQEVLDAEIMRIRSSPDA